MESNHDVEMLWVLIRESVKQRVMSRVGHLSNDALAEFFTSDYDGRQRTWYWRISEHNNHPKSPESNGEGIEAARHCSATA
jgi:hypothetical protein